MQENFDCSKLLINFTLCPKGKRLVNHFPEMKAFTEFVNCQDDNFIKIAACTADQDSPFLKMRGDHERMVMAIFEFIGIGTENRIGKEYLQKVIDYKHEGVIECWSAYLQMQFSIDFTDWAISKQTYDMLIKESGRQKAENEDTAKYADWRIKIRNQIRTIGEDLKKIEPLIFKDSKMVKPVAIEQIKIKNYPEKYAIKHSIM
jgi:hypothetical protein